jgi:hypothetical protein
MSIIIHKLNEAFVKLECEKQSYSEILNQKKDLNETIINLEKQVKTTIFLILNIEIDLN